MAKILYDRKNCEGYFVCVTMDPDSFEEGDDDKAELLGGKEIKPGLWEKEVDDVDAADQAAAGCPADVIKVVDDDGKIREGPERLPVEEETAQEH